MDIYKLLGIRKEPIVKENHLQLKLGKFINESKEKDIAYKIKSEKYLEESDALERKAKKELFPKLSPATREDYLIWLRGYVTNGNSPTHYYDYPFKRWNNFYVAKQDFTLIPLYGSRSINIIVPAGVKILGGDPGHCNIFCYDGYKYSGFVPVFCDTIF